MALGVVKLIPLIAILTVVQYGPGSALHVKMIPKPVSQHVNSEVSVTCVPDNSTWSDKIMVISVGKAGKRPLATIGHGGQIQHGSDWQSNLEAEGRIGKNASNSFLILTIQKPGVGDFGVYSCHIYYLDGFGQLREGKASGNLTLDNNKAMIVHLLKQVADLERSAQQNIKRMDDLDAKIKDGDTLIADQDKKITMQNNRTGNLETKVADLLTLFTDFQKAATKRDKKLHDQDLKLKHHEQLIASQEKQIKQDKAAFNNLVQNVSDLEKGLAQERETVKDQDNVLKRLQQLISDQAKQLKTLQGFETNDCAQNSSVSATTPGDDQNSTMSPTTPGDDQNSTMSLTTLVHQSSNKTDLVLPTAGPELVALMKVGSRVKRGRDWDWGNQDGPAPSLGRVIRLRDDKWIDVKWDYGTVNNYQMGHHGKYDLQLAQE